MDDILASIRRIIADDQSRQSIAAAARPARQPPGAAHVPADPPPAAALASDPDRPGPAAAPTRLQPPGETARQPVAASTASARPGAVPLVNGSTPHLTPPPLTDRSVFDEIAVVGAASALVGSPGPSTPRASDPASSRSASPAAIPAESGEAAAAGPKPPALATQATATPAASGHEAMRGVAEPSAAPPADPAPVRLPGRSDDGGAASIEPLVSDEVLTTIETSFQALATSVILQNGSQLDAMMRDMLRPMLKIWLDDNLPAIVERLVRVEIERVARGGRA